MKAFPSITPETVLPVAVIRRQKKADVRKARGKSSTAEEGIEGKNKVKVEKRDAEDERKGSNGWDFSSAQADRVEEKFCLFFLDYGGMKILDQDEIGLGIDPHKWLDRGQSEWRMREELGEVWTDEREVPIRFPVSKPSVE
uniref:Uncharacterized protein n=1 Tax=Chromera velia CCMP2878 TaxID=1169474 RepID=A0A0G4FS14_9ALVE|eukprot:Cvel_3671.t1-p1 / transcript=Cvel_3671.t1 / gene=Cvel_3671 / organism=Chromera_velia_CCMP2878 / gene_product=hypothetical protein / transcript_product=hypothetical protein / location=Cvel_scaffold152:100222-100641(+) / protein_length=140 / sequence_SO=supercontig / SO=protein_coding / is_pseudo=false